jgi:hypothetical protein
MSDENSSGVDVKALVEQAVAEATKGLVNNRDQIKGEKMALKQELENLKAQWGDLNPDQVKAFMSRLENDEETRLIAEGKIDEVLDRRTKALQGDYSKKLEASHNIQQELEGKLTSSRSRIKQLLLDNEIRRNAAEIGILPTAIDDALYRAKDVFTISDDDAVIAKDPDGSVVLGKNGRDPLSPSEWIDGMKEKAPHWFAQNSGGGASGGASNGSSGFTITRDQARNPSIYRQAKERAAKAGQPLRITE